MPVDERHPAHRRVRRGTPAAHRAHRRGAWPRPGRGARHDVRGLRGHHPQGSRRARAPRPRRADPRGRRRCEARRRGARVRRPRTAPAHREGRDRPGRGRDGQDGESIALDASTTALAMARHLKARRVWLHLTVITNGLRIAEELAGYPGHHRRDARRLPPLGGAQPRRAAGRWAVRQGQHPEGVHGRGRASRWRRGSATRPRRRRRSSASWSRARARSSASSTTRSGSGRRSRRSARRRSSTRWSPTPARPRRWSRRSRAGHRGVPVVSEATRRGSPTAIAHDAARSAAMTVAAGDRSRRPAVPAVALRGVSKRFAATQALSDVTLELRRRRDPRARRRERGRQEHAGQDPGGHPSARQRDGRARRRAGRAPRARPRAGAGHRRRPPGAAALPRPLGRRERLHRPRAVRAVRHRSTGGRCGARRQAVRRARRPVRRPAPVRGLSMADQQLIEIAKSLSVEAKVLVLDEPTASLSAHEVERLFTIVRRLRDRGVAVLFVSHRLDEVFDAVRPGDRAPRRAARRSRRRRASSRPRTSSATWSAGR